MEIVAVLLSIIVYLFWIWLAYEIVRRAVVAAIRTVLEEDGRLWVDRLAQAIARQMAAENKEG